MATKKNTKTTPRKRKSARRRVKKDSPASGGARIVGFTGDGRPLDEADQNLRGVIVRKDGRHLDRFLTYLPLPLGQRLRVHAAATRQDISAVFTTAVEAYLKEHNR